MVLIFKVMIPLACAIYLNPLGLAKPCYLSLDKLLSHFHLEPWPLSLPLHGNCLLKQHFSDSFPHKCSVSPSTSNQRIAVHFQLCVAFSNNLYSPSNLSCSIPNTRALDANLSHTTAETP